MSGHSKWSTIKRKKGANDEKRGQLFTKLAREITLAARSGVPDPDSNFRLRIAIDRAKSENLPNDNIQRAIERATGGAGGAALEEVTYEGFGPGGVALVVHAMTDNRNRTVGDVRSILTRSGGSLGENGSVAWMFDSVGQIVVGPGETDPEEVALLAIDAGADDVQVEEDAIEIFTQVEDLHTVQQQLADSSLEIQSAELTMKPKNLMEVDPSLAVQALRLLEKLDDLDDVQHVYSNLDVTDDVLATVS